jgi:hypothetical protein
VLKNYFVRAGIVVKIPLRERFFPAFVGILVTRTELVRESRDCFTNSSLDGFVEKGFGCGYVSFIVKSLSSILLRQKTKPPFETDAWPKPTPILWILRINEKPIQVTAPPIFEPI